MWTDPRRLLLTVFMGDALEALAFDEEYDLDVLVDRLIALLDNMTLSPTLEHT